jgi:hypothetical protein
LQLQPSRATKFSAVIFGFCHLLFMPFPFRFEPGRLPDGPDHKIRAPDRERSLKGDTDGWK